MAYVVILLLALVATGGLFTALQPRSAQAEAYSQDDVLAGEALFLANCATCHAAGGVGLKDSDGNTIGPSLVGVGAAAVDFQVGTGRMPMQFSGAQAARKPAQMDEEQTRQLAAYVASLGPGPAVPDEEIMNLAEADLVNGGDVFRINCAMCHNAAGAGGALTRGKFAPSLMGVEENHIYEAMQTGPQNMPVFNDANITPEEKRDVITYLKTVETNTDPGGFGLGSLGPVSEGLFIWTIGLMIIIGFTVWLTTRSA